MAVKGSEPAAGVIVPHLVVRDAEKALKFYVRAFAARVLYRSKSPSGRGEHLHLKIWASLLQISSEKPGASGSGVWHWPARKAWAVRPVFSRWAFPM